MLSMLTLRKVRRTDKRNRHGIDATMWDGVVTVGWVDYEIRNHHGHWLITDLHVKPEYRRLRVGWVIMDELKTLAAKRKKRLELRLPHTREFTDASYFLSKRPGCCGFSSVLDGDSVVFTWEGD